jgi:3',5'-nucleoside bisphosphate phosphatase
VAGDTFDFHLHTNRSDGACPPAEVMEAARHAGLAGISITDHDTVDAYDDLAADLREGPRVLPGIEVSTSRDGVEIHILGYFPDGLPPGLRDFTRRLVAERLERIRVGVNRLAEKGICLSWDEVLAEAGGPVVSRGHLAQLLLKKGYIPSIYAAFPTLLGPERIPPPGIDSREAVREILRLGGIPIWAHTIPDHLERFLEGLVEAGLAGLEILTPRRRYAEMKRLRSAIEGRNLLVTGGSDWHGIGEDPLGRFSVEAEAVGDFLRAIGWAPSPA